MKGKDKLTLEQHAKINVEAEATHAIIWFPDGSKEVHKVGENNVIKIMSGTMLLIQVLYNNGHMVEYYNMPSTVDYKIPKL